jgi:hypothetical protein
MCDPVNGRQLLAAALKRHGALFVDDRLSDLALSDVEGSKPVFPATSPPGLASQGQILSWLALRAIVSFIHDAESKAKASDVSVSTPQPPRVVRLTRSATRSAEADRSGARTPVGAFGCLARAWHACAADWPVLFRCSPIGAYSA